MHDTPRQLDKFLPDWTRTRFVVLDNSARWSSAIQRELIDQMSMRMIHQNLVVRFESCTTARDTLICCEMKNTVGLVMFMEGRERECLSVLGALSRRLQTLPLLVVCEDYHADLTPVLFEAGATSVLYGVESDVPLAQWCLRLLDRMSVVK